MTGITIRWDEPTTTRWGEAAPEPTTARWGEAVPEPTSCWPAPQRRAARSWCERHAKLPRREPPRYASTAGEAATCRLSPRSLPLLLTPAPRPLRPPGLGSGAASPHLVVKSLRPSPPCACSENGEACSKRSGLADDSTERRAREDFMEEGTQRRAGCRRSHEDGNLRRGPGVPLLLSPGKTPASSWPLPARQILTCGLAPTS